MIIHTENFHPLIDTKLLCTCGHEDCDFRSVSRVHLNRIQEVRTMLKIPLTVTSGGRCPHHPSEEHRTTPADHQKGNGADIKANGSTRGNIVAAGFAAGCNAIGVAKTFVHLGYRSELPDFHTTMWTY